MRTTRCLTLALALGLAQSCALYNRSVVSVYNTSSTTEGKVSINTKGEHSSIGDKATDATAAVNGSTAKAAKEAEKEKAAVSAATKSEAAAKGAKADTGAVEVK